QDIIAETDVKTQDPIRFSVASNGREIPKGASIFCTTDYGGSEGLLRRAIFAKIYEYYGSNACIPIGIWSAGI
ncbi:hypothetical protein D1646_20305, partial [Pseudoflavonifractor sp. 60]|uniref:hypothetical protein n=1 Tax=Pseudoflavonifractor sp. 60 TaxID=2304576 RepID=UPI00157F22BB